MKDKRMLALAGALLAASPAGAQTLPPFAPPVVLGDVPLEFTDVVPTDVTGDGLIDLVGVGTTGSGRMFLGVSTANALLDFDEPVRLDDVWEPTGLPEIADVDQDGALDLVVVANVGPLTRVVLLRGTGLGAPLFEPARFGPVVPPTSGDSLRVADRDGDGDLDLLVTSGNEVLLIEVNGAQLAGSAVPTGITVGPGYAVADLDGDGRAEIVGQDGFDLRVWPGDPALSSVLIPVNANIADGLRILDVDLDGNLDIALVAVGGSLAFLGNGALRFDPQSLLASGSAVTLGFADLDGDGDEDLIYLDGPPFPGTPETRWSPTTGTLPYATGPLFQGGFGGGGAYADVNGDGLDDLIGGLGYSLNQGNAIFGPGELYEIPVGPRLTEVVALDLDQDGREDDLVVIDEDGLGLGQIGQGQAIVPVTIDAAGAIRSLIALEETVSPLVPDDLLTLEESGGQFVLRQYGVVGQGLAFEQEYAIQAPGVNARIVDVSRKQFFPALQSLEVLLQSDDGLTYIQIDGFNTPIPLGVSTTEGKLVDLDGDGVLDVVGAAAPGVRIHRGRASGGFFAPAVVAVPEGLSGLDVADLDLDGRPDVVVQSATRTSVLVNRGALVFDPPLPVHTNRTPEVRQVTVGDLNGDDLPDLVLSPFNSGLGQGAVALIGDGALGISEFTVVLDKRFLESAPLLLDLDVDGDVDLAGITTDGTLVTSSSRFNPEVGVNLCPASFNSIGQQGALRAVGDLSLDADRLLLRASNLPPFVTTLMLAAPGGLGGQLLANSEGILCLTGPIGRFNGPGQLLSSGSDGIVLFEVPLDGLATPMGPAAAMAGERWNFQLWYRDVLGGMPTSNLTSSVSVVFTQ